MLLKNIKKVSGLFLAAVILCVCVILAAAISQRKAADDDLEVFAYAALGDSIPNGYSVSKDDSFKGYPQLLSENIEENGELSVNLSKYTKDGLTVNGLYEMYLSDAAVQEDLEKADLITVTIGANDLLNKFGELYQELFGEDIQARDMGTILRGLKEEAADDPELLAKAAEIISGWDCGDFEKDWKRAMESIRQNQKEDSQVIVTTIYNPVGETEILGILNQIIVDLINKLNRIIVDNSESYGYQTADLSEAGVEKHLQSDGLHPNQEGQQLIMEQIEGKYKVRSELLF